LALGSKPSRRHRNWYVLQIISKPEGAEKQVQAIIQALKSIEKHVIQARYPLKNERGKLTPPSDYYDKEKAEELLNKARIILEKTETTIKAMGQ
jgi:HEPN domain-containing protein